VAIGGGSSEILCLIKKINKTSRQKQKAFGTNVPGGLKMSIISKMVGDRDSVTIEHL